MCFFYHITGGSGDSSESILGSLGITPKKYKMDWAYGAPEDATSKAGLPALGFYVGDRYRACNGALGTLKDITIRFFFKITYIKLQFFSKINALSF